MKTNLLRALFICLFFFQSPLFAVGIKAKHKSSKTRNYCPKLKTISIVDRNGMTETISGSDRIGQYQNVNFLKPQPYQKVLRIYNRDQYGNIRAYIHSYHENGQPKQYLEVVNSRAYGIYCEWHSNGLQKLYSQVIGGEADIDPASEATWLFDGIASVWDEDEILEANIHYEKGKLQGDGFYYHPNGAIWKKIPYLDDEIHGLFEIYLANGQLLERVEYKNGYRHGEGYHYWTSDKLASKEEYKNGSLEFGQYYDLSGTLISEVIEGDGMRAIFGKTYVTELHEFKNGIPEGEIQIFGSDQKLIRKFHLKNYTKNGEEIEYYEEPHLRHLPKLAISWYEGKIQGIVKTWYDNGVQESKKEMSSNAKNGILTAWYRDGHLMLIEDYDHDKLVKGEYYRKGERTPVSTVRDGKGVAMTFDPEGNFITKIHYDNGIPAGTK